MKKLYLFFCITQVFTFSLQSQLFPSNKLVEVKYQRYIAQLQKYLETTLLARSERTLLINKLIGYFNNTLKTEISLQKPQTQLIYSFITKTYNELLSAQKSSPHKPQEDLAKKFSEQALGKIMLHKSKPKKS